MTSNELIELNMGLIKKIAAKFYNLPKEDLIQAGVIGLLKAYQNYRTTDAKFSTYAYPYIFGEMYILAKDNRNLKVSKDLLKILKVVEKTRYELAQRINRIPSNYEVATFLKLNPVIVDEAINSAQAMIELDNEADGINLYERIKDNKNLNIDLKLDLSNSIEELSDEEKRIIKARYYEDLTQSEVAKKLNMTQVMVSRYEKKGLNHMRTLMMK